MKTTARISRYTNTLIHLAYDRKYIETITPGEAIELAEQLIELAQTAYEHKGFHPDSVQVENDNAN